MRRMFGFGLTIGLALVAVGRAEAANLTVITNPPTMLDAIIFVAAVACAGGSIKVFGLVRGGRLSRCWQMFIFGFVLLAVAEIILLCEAFEIITLPEFAVPTLLAAMAGLFLFGILDAKRTLS